MYPHPRIHSLRGERESHTHTHTHTHTDQLLPVHAPTNLMTVRNRKLLDIVPKNGMAEGAWGRSNIRVIFIEIKTK